VAVCPSNFTLVLSNESAGMINLTLGESYPTSEECKDAWESLAQNIVEQRASLDSESELGEKIKSRGSLSIVGTGIECMGFTLEAVNKIEKADKVFFYASDSVTTMWIRSLRPDAYDLYVLYEDGKPRHRTYAQMSEAMLYYVREGKNVVAVFYGHPGIFVVPSHRAIEIAKREGYPAVMKAGVSALDTLCADLGLDPAFPGMQSYEATHMLLRATRPDTTMHLILWQVGAIGDTGYRRKGFVNKHFNIFVEYLQKYYGKDFEIVHYIGSRYPSFPPVITKYKLSELFDSKIQSQITGISTFHVPPRDAVFLDMDMAVLFGCASEGQALIEESPIRSLADYGPMELEAISELQEYVVPADYHFQEKTKIGEFLFHLSQDEELQRRYLQDSEEILSEKNFPGISEEDRSILLSFDERRISGAVRGERSKTSPTEELISQLLVDQNLSREFREVVERGIENRHLEDSLSEWSLSHKIRVRWESFEVAAENVLSTSLLPWTGTYYCQEKSVVVVVFGNPSLSQNSFVYVNSKRLVKGSFYHSVLSWSASEGNPHNGKLEFEMPGSEDGQNLRKMKGVIWEDGQEEEDESPFTAIETPPNGIPLSMWTGRYSSEISEDTKTWSKGPQITITPFIQEDGQRECGFFINDEAVDRYRYRDGKLMWGKHSISFSPSKGSVGALEFSGRKIRGSSSPSFAEAFYGTYVIVHLSTDINPTETFTIDEDRVLYGDQEVEEFTFLNAVLDWKTRDGDLGKMLFFIDPITLLPAFQGEISSSTSKETVNLYGILQVDSVRSHNHLDMPEAAWESLLEICEENISKGGLMLYHQWLKVRFTCRNLSEILRLLGKRTCV
jgi:hypothetical protein